MGLDCTAYSYLELAPEQCFKGDNEVDDPWDECYSLGHVNLYFNNAFPHTTPDIADLDRVCLTPTGKTEEFGWRAGSYGGYNMFRDTLARYAFYTDPGRHHGIHSEERREFWRTIEQFADKPFYEMINFSDCEGIIGPKVSAKLYWDFFVHHDKFMEAHEDEYDQRRYEDWMHAYDIARNDGVVWFH